MNMTVTVQANQSWQDTGQNVIDRQITRITAQGAWIANPATGMAGPGGNPALIAKPGYTLPGAPEGALIGRIGNNRPFVVGTTAQAPAGQTGPLQFCINDDLGGAHGSGLKDNRGALEVHIAAEPGQKRHGLHRAAFWACGTRGRRRSGGIERQSGRSRSP